MRRLLVLLVPVIILALSASTMVVAQGDSGNAARSGDSAATDSFATAFFVSRRYAQGEAPSIEIIGSLIIWFLLALSVVSIGMIGHFFLTNQRKSIVPDGVVEEVSRLLREGKFKDALALTEREESFFSKTLFAGLHEASNGFSAMIRALELTSDEHTTVRLRRIEYLNVFGQVSPMIGLFGTVYGMILAFQSIVAGGGEPNAATLAAGIGTALTTTFWGLVVAIPALAGYAIVRNKIDALTTEATYTAESLINQFRPKPGGRPRVAPEPKPESSPGSSPGSKPSS